MNQIVFIMTDTQRADMLGCYGNPDMHTPNLDKLAGQGVRFKKAYTCQPVCGPSRAALFTGLWPHSAGSWGNNMPLGNNIVTIGQRVQAMGIHTAYIGKWHLDGSDYFGVGRPPDGWDPEYWYDMRNYLEELSPEDRQRSRSTEINLDPDLTEDFTFAHRCSNRAVDFLSMRADDDFFMVVSYDEPHHPYVCPRPYSEMYRDYIFPKSKNIWDTLEKKPDHHRIWAGERLSEDKDALEITPSDFLGCNSYVDYEIGRVIDAIDQYAPNALVIYTSDHGDMLDSHSINNKGAAMYDEITRIPWIVRWPGRSPNGLVCNHPVSHIDLAPTIMDVLGLEIPKTLQGRSMLKTFQDPEMATNETIFMEFARYEVDHDSYGGFQPIRAAFDGQFKLVINLLATDEMYDLEDDPEEMVNLIDSESHIKIRDRLHDKILEWMNDTRDPFRGYYWERRPWRGDARPATWSYTGMTRQRESEESEPRQLDYNTGLEITAVVREE